MLQFQAPPAACLPCESQDLRFNDGVGGGRTEAEQPPAPARTREREEQCGHCWLAGAPCLLCYFRLHHLGSHHIVFECYGRGSALMFISQWSVLHHAIVHYIVTYVYLLQ